MSTMERMRAYHAVLAVLTVAAFATGEAGAIHAWLGYAVALVIAGRLAAALAGLKQLGLARFYPQFAGLRLGTALTHPAISRTILAGIAASLIAVTATGIHLDGGHTLGFGDAGVAAGGPARVAAAGPAHVAEAGPARVAEAGPARVAETGPAHGGGRDDAEGDDGGLVEEAHEALANLLVLLVGLHVLYLVIGKRSLARFMLFLAPTGRPPGPL